jgi:hypothetical protein
MAANVLLVAFAVGGILTLAMLIGVLLLLDAEHRPNRHYRTQKSPPASPLGPTEGDG